VLVTGLRCRSNCNLGRFHARKSKMQSPREAVTQPFALLSIT
jgi:hypothetical protein